MPDKIKRNNAFDYLKVIAVIFVVLLHVNGYAKDLIGIENYSSVAKVWYYSFEALAYPAIHIFVLIGSYFMVDRVGSTKSAISRIYSQTWTVTVIGLIAALLLVPDEISVGGVLQSVLPFSQRAYWFVSDYIILLALSKFLNMIINNASKRQLLNLTIILLVITCILPFASVGDWDKGNLILFITLYFVAAIVKRNEDAIKKRRMLWGILWGLLVIILASSTVIITALSNKIGYLSGKEMLLYQYASPVVLLEGVCLFLLFVSKEYKNSKLPVGLRRICDASLFVYLIHMHPIIKGLYTKYSVLSFINTDGWSYAFWIILVVVSIVILGTLIGCYVLKPVSIGVEKLIFSFSQKAVKRR